MGAQQDYFIAVSTTITNAISKKFYYSNDEGATFAQLASADKFVRSKAPKIRGMFSGNPSLKFKDPDAGPKLDEEGNPIELDEDEEEEEEEEEAPAEDEMDEDGNPIPRAPIARKLNELERLSYCVATIDASTAIVPRGRIYMNALGDLIYNSAFEGLSLDESRKLSNFQLLRTPESPTTLAAIRRAGVANHHDCLDTLSPTSGGGSKVKNTWSLITSDSGLEVALRSLLFPGFEYHLEAGTNNYSGAYFGLGEKNADLLFML